LNATVEKIDSALEVERFRAVPSVAFSVLDSLGTNLYHLRENDPEPVLLCGQRQSLTSKQLAEIRDRGHMTLLVRKQDFFALSGKLLGFLDQVLEDASISVEERFALLQVAYAEKIEKNFRKPFLEQYIEIAQEVGVKISALLQDDHVSTQSLFDFAHHNSLHYSHITNATAYAVVLALAMEMADPDELDRIAVGCMLHEVGKLFLPNDLQDHHCHLSPYERQELQRAPQLAYEALCDCQSVDAAQLMMIYQQSERLDGTGYPVRNVEEEIQAWAKLLAVVDTFDTSTSEAGSRAARNLQDALHSLSQGAKTHFDPEMILCWITSFQLQ